MPIFEKTWGFAYEIVIRSNPHLRLAVTDYDSQYKPLAGESREKNMAVELVREYSDELLDAMNKLIPQLSSSTPQRSAEFVQDFLAQPSVFLFVYRPDSDESDEAPILGMLSLATFDIPTGRRAWIEDVVVDESARGQGAGQKLVEAAVAYAQEIGSKSVDLTSRPTREAANRLYRRAGFGLRETNVYRYKD